MQHKAIKFISLFVLTFMVAVSSVVPAFALDVTEAEAKKAGCTTDELKNYIETSTSNTIISMYLTDDSSLSDSPDQVIINNQAYYFRKGYTESDFKSAVIRQYKSSRVTSDAEGITNGLNVEANTNGATMMLSGFVPVINMLIGLIAVLIELGMAVYTAFDIAYIVFPVFRNNCSSQKMSGEGLMVKQGPSGETKFRFISDEAVFAVENCSLAKGGSPLTMYLKKRVLAYIMLGIVMFILLTGNISLITTLALKLVGGIMNVFQGIG